MHLLDQLERPIIFAHRGASVFAPENTMSAFKLAVKLGVKAIELDTMLSSDGIPVVIHDQLLERTTNGHGQVGDYKYSELAQLDAGSWFSDTCKGEKIPALSQILEYFSGRVLINIELKNFHAPNDNLTETVMQLVDQNYLWDSILFSSFLPRNLRLIRKRKPDAKVALLCPAGSGGWVFRSSIYKKLSPEIIHLAKEDVTREYLQHEHHRGRRVHVWTVNDKTRAEELFLDNVDGIITDDPVTMLEILRQNSSPVK